MHHCRADGNAGTKRLVTVGRLPVPVAFAPSGPAPIATVPRPIVTRTRAGIIEHTDDGHGQPLLAIHGGVGGFDQSWLLARALVDENAPFRVLAVSRPGYLGTPLAVGDTPERQADAFAALLDTLGVERAVVAANSAGGLPAIQFALRHPTRCAGLILVSCVSGPLGISAATLVRLRVGRVLARTPGIPTLLRHVVDAHPAIAARQLISDPDLAAQTLADPAGGPLLRALMREVFIRPADRMPGIINDVASLRDSRPLPLAEVAVPTLVVHGTRDSIVAAEHGRRAARLIPGARFVALVGGEHFALFTHMRQLRQSAAAFLGIAPGDDGTAAALDLGASGATVAGAAARA